MANNNEIKCSICAGAGAVSNGLCPQCHGAGFGIWDNGRFFYWGKAFSRGLLVLTKTENLVRGVLNFLFLLFGLFGPIFLIYAYRLSWQDIFYPVFWQTPAWPKIIFLLSILGDCYLVYRLIRESEGRGRITAKSDKSDKASFKTTPATWQEAKKLSKKNFIDVSRGMSADADRVIKDAFRLAGRLRHAETGALHLFAALTSSTKAQIVFSRLDLDSKGLRERLARALSAVSSGTGQPLLSVDLKRILIETYQAAMEKKQKSVSSLSLLVPVVKASPALRDILFDLGIEVKKLENAANWQLINEELRQRYRAFHKSALRKPKGNMNRAMTALETRVLNSFSDDLTLAAGLGYLEMCVGRQNDFEKIFRVLDGEHKSLILVGERGVGKDAVLEGLAWKMVEEEVPDILKDKRLVRLSVPKLVSGATPAQAAERLMECLRDVRRSGNVVLVVSDIYNMAGVGAGGSDSIDLADIFASELQKGYFFTLATSNPQDYATHVETTDLGNVLMKIEIDEPEVDEAIKILEAKVGMIEYQAKTFFSYDALEKAVVLSDRLIHDRFLPQKAVEVAKEAAVMVRSKRGAGKVITGEDIAQIITERTKIPVTSVTQGEAEKLMNLEKIMHQRIIGQDEAVKLVSAALRRSRAELRDSKRPIANFLFLGPTGVGKTETAKAVAESYFGGEDKMIRLDMSEYQGQDAIHRLLGAPGGPPAGGGLLTEPVRKNPFSLLLLDEIEKAHPDILNIFLQVMDDGRVTDASGRVIDFTNVILIATSNAGTSFIQSSVQQGKGADVIKKELVERELKGVFRPEFLNRFDAVVVFKPLAEKEIFQIAKLILGKIAKQLEAKGIFLQTTDEAVEELAQAGFDPIFGARPLRRVIQEKVQDALANFLLTKKVSRRDVVILEKGGVIRVEKAKKL